MVGHQDHLPICMFASPLEYHVLFEQLQMIEAITLGWLLECWNIGHYNMYPMAE